MSGLSFELREDLEPPLKHVEELENLLQGIKGWCAATVESCGSAEDALQDNDRHGKLDD